MKTLHLKKKAKLTQWVQQLDCGPDNEEACCDFQQL